MAKVQLFSYDIDTHDQAKINQILSAKGADPNEMTQEQYFQLQINLQRDLIKQSVVPAIAPDTLPVFLAPEFFFKWRDNLPYSRPTFFNVMSYFETLSAQVPAVLWCVGSVWWSEPADGAQVRVHNSALVYQGGRLLHSWQKVRLSGIDGLDQGPQTWDRWDPASQRILEETQSPFFSAACPNGDVVSCGVEVCLDHMTLANPVSHGVMREMYVKDDLDPPQGAGVDLHIVTAAGMGVQPENIVSRSGGAYFRCDGGSGAAPRSQSIAIDRAGPSPAAALRAWAPQRADGVAQYLGADAGNRLAVFPAVTLH